MRTILYIIAVVMIIGRLLGFFVFSAGYLIHVIIIFAVISILISLIRRSNRKVILNWLHIFDSTKKIVPFFSVD
jgi:uncharacterized membrane protein